MNVRAPMRQCTATADVIPHALLSAVLAGQRQVSPEDLSACPQTLWCELALWHEGEHADHVWDWPNEHTHALWARWTTDGEMRFESVPWCETNRTADEDPCTLYRGHAREHSWALHDPETEAARRRALVEHAGLLAWPTRSLRKPT